MACSSADFDDIRTRAPITSFALDPLLTLDPVLRLQTFGDPALLRLRDDGTTAVLLGPGKPLLLLAHLEAHPEGVQRDVLAALCWGDQDDQHARASLRQGLYRLRQELGQERITTEGETVALVDPPTSDRADFLAAITTGDDARACALYRGPFLAGVNAAADGDGLANWEAEERERFATLWRTAALRRARGQLEAGDAEAAAVVASRVVEADSGVVEAWSLWLDALTGPGQGGQRADVVARLEAALLAGRFTAGDRFLAEALRQRQGSGTAGHRPPRHSELALVGRDLILERLLLVTNGNGGREERPAVLLEGAAGLGKSRLLRELATRLDQRGTPSVVVTALPSERRLPWALLTRMVRTLADRPGARGVSAATVGTLTRLDPELAGQFSATRRAAAEPPSTRAIEGAVVDLLLALHETAAFVLLLDDLHFGDVESLQLLSAIIERPDAAGFRMVGGTRPGQHPLPPLWVRWQVTPLDRHDMTLLVERSLPQLQPDDVIRAAGHLMLLTGGVPLYVRRALQLLVDAGALRIDDGVFQLQSTSPQLVELLTELSLQHDPRFPTDRHDQALIGYLAIAEEAVTLTELEGALDGADFGDLLGRLERLAHQGWIHLSGQPVAATLAHVVIAGQVATTFAPGRLRALRELRAWWLREHGTRIADLQAAVRLFVGAGRPPEALATLREWRRREGRRGASVTERLVPAEAGVLLGWRLRLAASRQEWLFATGTLLALTAAISGWTWWQNQPVELRLENTPVMFPILPNNDIVANHVPPIFTVRNRRGEVSRALDGDRLSAGEMVGVSGATWTNMPIVQNGRVDARAALLLAETAEGAYDSIVANFQVGNLHSDPVFLAWGFSHSALSVVTATLNNQVLGPSQPTVVVGRGGSLEGFVVLHYSTPSIPVLWYMGSSSTFPAEIPEETGISSLNVGASNAVLRQNVHLTAPTAPGSYWLVWAFAPETSWEWIYSRTNWKCLTPLWHDGNDLLDRPEEVFVAAWGGGFIDGTRRMCEEGAPPYENPTRTPVATIRVMVE